MRIILVLLLIVSSKLVFAQSFPKDFLGHWQGELEWFQTGKTQKIKMQLIIDTTNTPGQYSWQIIYGEKVEDNRPYILRPVDTALGHWVIDERDGILLDQYWIGKRFTGAFTVQNSTIVDSYWIEGKNLNVEFYSISSTPVQTTGGTSEDVPAVDSYMVKSYQRGMLRRATR